MEVLYWVKPVEFGKGSALGCAQRVYSWEAEGTKWENRQFMVKCDGSGRLLLRTRGHLRKIQLSVRDRRWYDVDPQGQ